MRSLIVRIWLFFLIFSNNETHFRTRHYVISDHHNRKTVFLNIFLSSHSYLLLFCFFFSFLLRTLVHSFTGHCWFFVFCSMRSTIFNDNNMLFLFFTWFLTSSPAPIGFPLFRTFPLVARAKAKSPFHIQGLSRESRCSSNSRQVTDKQKRNKRTSFFFPPFFFKDSRRQCSCFLVPAFVQIGLLNYSIWSKNHVQKKKDTQDRNVKRNFYFLVDWFFFYYYFLKNPNPTISQFYFQFFY